MMREAWRNSPASPRRRPASAAAGTKVGASRTADERERARLGAIGRLGGERPRGQQHGALARIGGLVGEPGFLVALQPVERAGPVAFGAAEIEHRLAGPGGRGGIARRFLGDEPRARRIVAPLRLDVEAMQAEQPGVVAQRHGLEGALGGRPVAGELGRLGAEQQRQRLAGRDPQGLVGEFAGRARVARSDRDQALRQRQIAAPRAAHAQALPQHDRRARQRPQDRPGHDRERRHRADRDRQDRHRGVDPVALPGDRNLAGAVGEPDGPDRQQPDDGEKDDDADHAKVRFKGRAATAPPRHRPQSRGWRRARRHVPAPWRSRAARAPARSPADCRARRARPADRRAPP